MAKINRERREFLKKTSLLSSSALILAACGGGGSGDSTPTNPTTPTNPVTQGDGITIKQQDRALVFVMLDGGNDSFNMLVPYSATAYAEYQKTRANLALNKNDLRPLSGFTDSKNRTFALHPKLSKIQSLFHEKKLAFVANIAPLIEPVTKEEFKAGSKPLPVGLLSHSDQFKHWQTSKPGERINQGWFGTFSDVLQKNIANDQISMNISLAGSNIMQNGKETREYAITDKGSIGLLVKDTSKPELRELNKILQDGFSAVMSKQTGSAFKDTYLGNTRYSQQKHEKFQQALQRVNVSTVFPKSDLAKQLKMVARTIKAADQLGTRQQTFFVRYIGWDHHDELLKNHAKMLEILDDALGAFQTALGELGVAKKVTTFTGSDFGRSLTSNGNGTDHGWGGNTLVMGEDVNGGKVYGDYPALSLNAANPLDSGEGVLIPTTATDELYAELALWFGVQKGDLDKLFPNLKHFYQAKTSQDNPLGLMKVG